MRKRLPKILVTGGAGFIGSAFARLAININHKVVIVDKLTYAGDLARLQEVKGKYKFYKADVCSLRQIEPVFKAENPTFVIHFAAESHVDRSIKDASAFIDTNIKGTQVLLDISRKYKVRRFVHISTDEVYGDIKRGRFTENSPLKPSSPYASSKAAADLLIKSYVRTYKFPAVIIRPCNNYGPWQYPEKLIPLAILKILKNEKVPIYARGKNVREWLYVEDCARGIYDILKKGMSGEIYNLGSGLERRNIDLIKTILCIMHCDMEMVKFVKDRLGHDIRYSLDSSKLSKLVNWKLKANLNEGLKLTVDWYIKHKEWLFKKI